MNAKQRSAARQSVWRVLGNVRNREGKYMIRMGTLRRKAWPNGRLMPTVDDQVNMLADMASNIRTADRYMEPGYDLDDDKVMILFGDWNSVTEWNMKLNGILTIEPLSTVWGELCEWLEKRCEMEWEDEWTVCSYCGGAVRTEPNGYGWLPSYIEHRHSSIVCHECIEKDPERYLDWWVENDRRAITNEMIDPSDHGYVRLKDDCQHGFHRGQDASPEVMAEAMRKRGVKRFLFTIDGAGQFGITFSLWVHKDELEQAGHLSDDDINGPSVSAAMEKALQSAPLCPDPEPEKDGVLYRKINIATGEVTTRKISPQEFVEKGIS